MFLEIIIIITILIIFKRYQKKPIKNIDKQYDTFIASSLLQDIQNSGFMDFNNNSQVEFRQCIDNNYILPWIKIKDDIVLYLKDENLNLFNKDDLDTLQDVKSKKY